LYYNGIAGGDYRIEGSTASGQFQQGAFKIGFAERNRIDGVTGETAYRNFGASLNLQAYGMGGTQTSLSSPTVGRTFRGMKVCPPPVGPTTSGWNNLSSNIPQVMIGLTDEEAINSFVGGRRGTLSIASQFRVKPATSASPPTGPFGVTIEDQYNIGLYNYEGYPVSAIYSGGGNYGTSTVKTFGINFLGEGGNAIAGDVPFLYATTDATLSRAYQRTANFGINFRIGINAVPPPQPIAYTSASDPIFNFAGLIVGGYSEAIPSGYEQAIISKGTLTIDQSTYSGGGGANQGLIIKDNTITTTYGTTRFSTSEYYGDWGIQYTKANASEAGLNFWKPSGGIGSAANGILYLSDNGNISIGFDPYSTTPFATGGGLTPKLSVNGGGYFSNGLYAAGGVSGYNNTGFPGTGMWFSGSESNVSAGLGYVIKVSTSPLVFGSGAGSRSYSVRGANDIWSGGLFVAASDNRIKNIVKIPETSESLEIIKKIQVTDYSYIDSIKNPGIHRKLIAQNIKEHLPSAVSERVEFIPNIYDLSVNITKNGNVYTVQMEDLKDIEKGDKLKLSIDENDTIEEVIVISIDKKNKTFNFESNSPIKEKVFVYGKEIQDFLTLDYDSVASTHISATQELIKIIDSQANVIKNLEDKLSKIEALLSKNGIK
jgi:hypothetical protein